MQEVITSNKTDHKHIMYKVLRGYDMSMQQTNLDYFQFSKYFTKKHRYFLVYTTIKHNIYDVAIA